MSEFKFKPLDYWYDEQTPRYFKQFMRVFSGFQYATGKDENGNRTLRQVPCRYADPSRMVAHIMRNQSENMLLSVPMITCWITQMTPATDRRQGLGYVRKSHVVERAWDETQGEYSSDVGIKATVESRMALAMDMTCQVDIWVSNISQKMQLFEQIVTLFNPALEIQSSVNALDWGALTTVELQDVTWSSRSVPVGTDDGIEILSMTFKVPIWISPPAKVKSQKLIEQVVMNLADMDDIDDFGGGFDMSYSESDLLARIIVSPENASVVVEGNELTLYDSEGNLLDWAKYLEMYPHEFRNGISQVRLKPEQSSIEEDDADMVGVIELHSTDPSKLIWTPEIETLPVNTLNPITAIIDPHKTSPGSGLPAPTTGQRYLLTDELGSSLAWNLASNAKANDIIEYNGSQWIISFDSGLVSSTEYVLNSLTGKQIRWNGEAWHIIPDGEYGPGYWRLDF